MNTKLPIVVICDDDATFHLAVKHTLKGRYDCRSAYHGDEALALVRNHPVAVLLLDIQMRTHDEGLRYLPRLLEADPDLAIVMSSAMTDFPTVREAMRLGAVDYVPKDFDPDDLGLTIARVLERRQLLLRQERQNYEVSSVQRRHVMIGETPAMTALRRTIEKFRASGANVLITGETGTGKEVVARQLRGTLPDGSLAPFVAVDSATIQSSTAESLLFGHERGAFTGAERTTKGIFEEAHGGIVYFDEIGNMPLDIQAKLLRVLQEKEITRMGSSRVIELEFRVVCATNRDLEAMARAGQFKDDLLQRLNVLPVSLPPLRERAADIPALAAHFAAQERGTEAPRFTPEALSAFHAYDWPGNIRELCNTVAYLLTMAETNEIDLADLPPRIRDRAARLAPTASPRSGGTFYAQVGEFERGILSRAYSEHEGNVSRMALALGMDRSHLHHKLKEHGIHQPRR
jgi:DNA-binding NtrC family response regulator